MSRQKQERPRLTMAEGSGTVVVSLDGRFVSMEQRVVAHFDAHRVRVELELVPPGQYVVTGVTFAGTKDDPVDSASLRIPLTDLVAEVTAYMTSNLVEGDDGTWVRANRITMAEARQVTRRAPKRSLTPEFLLGAVAPIIAQCERDGVPYGPVLAKEFQISATAARNWKMKLDALEGES